MRQFGAHKWARCQVGFVRFLQVTCSKHGVCAALQFLNVIQEARLPPTPKNLSVDVAGLVHEGWYTCRGRLLALTCPMMVPITLTAAVGGLPLYDS